MRWLGLDIGGANIKAALPGEREQARNLPFQLWKRPEDLPRMLGTLIRAFEPADALAVTMTAELCDCFDTKAEGVNRVLDGVVEAAQGRPARIWGIDGRFHDIPDARENPRLIAAANWLALATLAARLVPQGPGLLIDIGSTTSDIIPLQDGLPVARGTSDTERLQTGELVYAGVMRTPIAALATTLPYRGVPTGLAAELFASTLDIYLTLGEIFPDPNDLSTSDGRPRTLDAARDRLARMIGADREEFSEDDAVAFSREADEALMDRLHDAAKRATFGVIGRPKAAVISGSGEFLARRLAERVLSPDSPIIGLNEAWGEIASAAGCAHAVAVLADEQLPAKLVAS